jgi:protein-S-isoprenylcysteine O-methyltransferase Ste14
MHWTLSPLEILVDLLVLVPALWRFVVMTMACFFDWFQLAALACLWVLGKARGVALYARGVRVVVIDRQRTPAQMLADLLAVICLLLWWYELVAYAWPLRVHLVPPLLGVVLVDALAIKVMGAAMMGAGLGIYGLALRAFGDSWRVGLDHERPGALVTGGVFAWTRNPIYVSLDLLALGTFLIQGRLLFLVLALVLGGLLHLQIRREERFLAETYGDAYRAYCARVGRYVTWRRAARARRGKRTGFPE